MTQLLCKRHCSAKRACQRTLIAVVVPRERHVHAVAQQQVLKAAIQQRTTRSRVAAGLQCERYVQVVSNLLALAQANMT